MKKNFFSIIDSETIQRIISRLNIYQITYRNLIDLSVR